MAQFFGLIPLNASNFDSEAAASGQVLTADGAGGATFETSAGWPSSVNYLVGGATDITLLASDSGKVLITNDYHVITLPGAADGLVFTIICPFYAGIAYIYAQPGEYIVAVSQTSDHIYPDLYGTYAQNMRITLVGSTTAAKWFSIEETYIAYYNPAGEFNFARWTTTPSGP